MRIGIDLGGSHIACGIVEGNRILAKKEIDMPKEKIAMEEKIHWMIQDLIENLVKENRVSIQEISSIGIAAPGTIKEGIIFHAVNLGLDSYPIQEKLKQIYPNISINVKNDAKCAAIAEYAIGSMQGFENAIFLTLGTGIGGAVFYQGSMLEAKKNPGFELGHMIIQKENAKRCNCGKKGCFETYASMKAWKEKIRKALNLSEKLEGQQLKDEILRRKQEPQAKVAIQEYIEDLSIGISNLITIFEPDVVAIGGSFSYYQELLLKPLQERIQKGDLLFNASDLPVLKIATLKNDAGILGASMLEDGLTRSK